ncbi:MAG: ECF-type sigma factor [Acidobacteriota bacterium]
MTGETTHDMTRLLAAWGDGDDAAFARLFPRIYDDLRRLAHGRMRHERAQHTLDATALVHEAFVRLARQRQVQWDSRGQFFALAAQMMRRVLVDHARRRHGAKRGGDAAHVALDDASAAAADRDVEDVLRIHDALDDLARFDRRKATMVELRFFGGFSIDETARCLSVSPGTVMRDWTLAKAWLKHHLRSGEPAAACVAP